MCVFKRQFHFPRAFSERWLLSLSQVLLVIFLLIVYWRGEGAYILIHDNLDSNVVWLRLLAEQGNGYFDLKTTIPSLLNGVPIVSLSPGFSIGEMTHLFLDTLPAIIINEVIARFVAFWGMFLLLRRHILKNRPLVLIGVALCFALLPFWPAGFLSVSGQPLVLYAFLNLLQKEGKRLDWLFIVLYPFCSSLVLAGFAVVFLLIVIFIVDTLRQQHLNRPYLAGLSAFCVLYLVANYRLIYATFLKDGFVSHRVEFKAIDYGLNGALELIHTNFFSGQYHAASLHGAVILVSVVMAFILLYLQPKSDMTALFRSLFISCLAISIFYGTWKYFKPDFPEHLVLRGFQWERLHFLHPLLWHLLFAVSLGIILEKSGKFRSLAASLVLLMICAQTAYAVRNCDAIREKENSGMSYADFYSAPLFEEIAKVIGQDKSSYRIACLGFHPAVAQFNGFYTIDGYVANYSVEYKKNFRKIIAGELVKSPQLKRSFDDWGSRCYLYAAEVGYSFLNQKESSKRVQNLQIDIEQFRQMGGGYIFSAVPILNYHENQLSPRGVFEREDSPWRIWLYEVIQPGGEAV